MDFVSPGSEINSFISDIPSSSYELQHKKNGKLAKRESIKLSEDTK